MTDVHCEHGTFIGGPCGPDYLCGWCEDGISAAERLRILRDQELWRAHDRIAKFDRVAEAWSVKLTWRSDLAQILMDWAERPDMISAALTVGYLT